MKWMARVSLVLATAFTILGFVVAPTAFAQQKKPNILVIMTDDVGVWNISAYLQVTLDAKGEGTGQIMAAAKIKFDKGQYVIESYRNQYIKATNARTSK
jgi:hypothetical protein